jgi:FlaA1/EpsC-like NDP-sugar epimerase
LQDIPRLISDHSISEVIIAVPEAPGEIIRRVVQACKKANVVSKTIPSVFEILSGSAIAQLREVKIEDLLRRGTIHIETRDVESLLSGACVMVTGAGGSIGSELCRQIAHFRPKELVLLGHGENSIFKIAGELRNRQGLISESVRIHTVIADIRDRDRMNQVFRSFRPEIVFHAAAHKHVGLMQMNVCDAVTNNVEGTRILVDLADKYDVKRLVMISSDKAVNPTGIMGVTKRVAELVVHDAAERTGKNFVAVRFGNVLGSSGSVVPIFRQQIQEGGPVKITHPEVTRFFMTIPEAVQLVLQAGTMGKGGEIFVLDMGKPIKILDLARDLIRLSGLTEGDDIKIEFIGLQKGEKMHEELFYDTEKAERSRHEKILVWNNGAGSKTISKPSSTVRHGVEGLIAAAHKGDKELVQRAFVEIVPQYHIAESEPAESDQPTVRRGIVIPILQNRRGSFDDHTQGVDGSEKGRHSDVARH